MELLGIDPAFVKANQAEAAVWWLIAAVFGWYAWSQQGVRRRQCLQSLVVFFLFGLSDLVETTTGAWWRPWWLLVWKVACVLAMVYLLWTIQPAEKKTANDDDANDASHSN